MLATYRSWLLRSVGDYQGQVLQKLGANCTLADEQLLAGLQFDQRIDALMKRLWDDLVQEGARRASCTTSRRRSCWAPGRGGPPTSRR